MKDKFILVSLEDERSKKIAHALSNKTCKKIIDILAETKELSEKDLSDKLKLPINTVEYNLKKLLETGLIEKTKNFFWSKKGKKIDLYKLSNKSIVISPKRKFLNSDLKSLLPVALISGIAALAIRYYFIVKQKISFPTPVNEERVFSVAEDASVASAQLMQTSGADTILTLQVPSAWIWFLAGALFSLLAFSIFKLTKQMKGGKK